MITVTDFEEFVIVHICSSTCERVDTFFSPRMWHHAGRPTTGHSTETIGINVTSPQETDNCTLILDKQKFKASISPKNELDYPSY